MGRKKKHLAWLFGCLFECKSFHICNTVNRRIYEVMSDTPWHFKTRKWCNFTDLELGATSLTCFFGLYTHDATVCSTPTARDLQKETKITSTSEFLRKLHSSHLIYQIDLIKNIRNWRKQSLKWELNEVTGCTERLKSQCSSVNEQK